MYQSKPNKLFLSHIRPHKPVSPATLARWIRELLQLVGIDTATFKGHSVRAAVATELQNTVSLSQRSCSLQTGLERIPLSGFTADLISTPLLGGQSYQVPHKFK